MKNPQIINKLGIEYKKTKDEKVFNELVKQLRLYYWGVLYNSKYRYLGHDSMQLVIDLTIEHMWRSIDTFDESRGVFKTWATTILLNNTRGIIIKNYRDHTLELFNNTQVYVEEVPDYLLKVDLDKLILDLPEPQKSIVWKKYIDNVKYKDLAIEYNILENTLKSKIRNAVYRMRKLYAENPNKYQRSDA